MKKDKTFLRRQGANFLSVINDLKRNQKAAADDLQVSVEIIEKIIGGKMDIPSNLIQKATEVWPVNGRDFMVMEDDCPEGVSVMTKEESKKSSRIFDRGGSPYYEYRDTAMSKISAFRPEWILELREVDDDAPENPAVEWNNGHFMHQFTMFINAVNFYYIEDNEKKIFRANTGDSMYITPFVPHTFTTRAKDSEKVYGGKKGLILALTYGNKLVGDAQQELSALGGQIPHKYCYDNSSREAYFATILQQQISAMSIDAEYFTSETNIDVDRLNSFLKGECLPTESEYKNMASLFNVNVRDLLPPDSFDKKVILNEISKSNARKYCRYHINDLAMTKYLPYSKALLMKVSSKTGDLDLEVPLHQYCYNFGDKPVKISWESPDGRMEKTLESDDSLYIKPCVAHGWSTFDGDEASLLCLRIGGKIVGDAQRELSHIGRKSIKRIYEEYALWYKEE